jgi:choline dehydrogenase
MSDYVIVGAGSAGCVLASRLTEDPSVSVVLLEAGGSDRRREVAIPAAFARLFRTSVDWAFETEPQPHLGNRRLFWPRGKMLGGSSSLNAMIYSRANPLDHDRWAALGNAGWGYRDVLPYYKRAENQERGASEYHGVGGPLNVADLRSVNPLSRAFVAAGQEAGLPFNGDFNGASQLGVGFFQVTQRHGRRWSAADAYLKPAAKRRNLSIELAAQATRVVVEGGRAVGIEYVQAGNLHVARAEREVIIAGGAVNSPQILLLSGIGPADQLRQLGVPITCDLPGVGEGLQDHLASAVMYRCLQPVSLASATSLGSVLGYFLFHRGPLTSNVAEAGGFLRSREGSDAPDLELVFAPAYFREHGAGNPPGHGFSLGIVLERPQSWGYIRLRSTDPRDPPLIQPNYLAELDDCRALVEGIHFCRRLVGTKAFAPYRGEEYLPGQRVRTDAEVRAFIQEHAQTLYHPIGTCRMGVDDAAVVDPQLRVRGIERLRVADASVFPTQITGHTNAPTIMLAEKAADLIRGRS